MHRRRSSTARTPVSRKRRSRFLNIRGILWQCLRTLKNQASFSLFPRWTWYLESVFSLLQRRRGTLSLQRDICFNPNELIINARIRAVEQKRKRILGGGLCRSTIPVAAIGYVFSNFHSIIESILQSFASDNNRIASMFPRFCFK